MPGEREASAAAQALRVAPGPERHAHGLAREALKLAREGRKLAAWLLADRLCRILDPVNADALALRATIAQMIGQREQMQEDLARALALAPRHPVANVLALRFLQGADRAAAAGRLLGPSPDAPHLALAIGALIGGGAPLVAALGASETSLLGWAAWPGEDSVRLDLTWLGHEGPCQPGSTSIQLFPDPAHPLRAEGISAATVILPWPEAAAGCRAQAGGDDAARRAVLHGAALRRPVPRLARPHPARPVTPEKPTRLAVIVPVHGDAAATRRCLEMLARDREARPFRRIIVVDDASPDPAIVALTEALAAAGAIELVRNQTNLGFAESVNRALAMRREDEDALLLNADAELPPGAWRRLEAAAYAAPDVGTVTPLSNNGEYTSVPLRFRDNPLLDPEAIIALDRQAARVNAGVAATIPNGIGFCLYIRRDVLGAIGPLNLDFGRGYCEDVDFCLRAAQAGYRNVCAADVYVGHAGASSFGLEKRALVMDNLARIRALYPSYQAASAAFLRADPLSPAAARLKAMTLAQGAPFRLIVRAEGRVLPGWLAGEDAAAEPMVHSATASFEQGRVELRFEDRAGHGAGALRLGHDAREAAAGLRGDLAELPIAAITLIDPQELPRALLDAAAGCGAPYDVAVTRPGLACGRMKLARRRGGAAACCNGWCPLDLEEGRDAVPAGSPPPGFLAGASAIIAATPELARILEPLLPAGLMIGTASVAERMARAPIDPPRLRGGAARRLIIVPGGRSLAAQHAVMAIAAAARREYGDIEIVLLGEAADDLALMRGGVFVTGPVPLHECAAWIERFGGGHVLLMSRHGVAGEPDAASLLDAGWPVARFDWGVPAAGEADGALRLRADARAGDVASRIARWLGGGEKRLDREERAIVETQP